MTEIVMFFAAMSVPTGIIVIATRRALRAIDAQYQRAVEQTS